MTPAHTLCLGLVGCIALPAWAQSVDHARQLFDAGKVAEAKSELASLQRANGRNAAAAYLYVGVLSRIGLEPTK